MNKANQKWARRGTIYRGLLKTSPTKAKAYRKRFHRQTKMDRACAVIPTPTPPKSRIGFGSRAV